MAIPRQAAAQVVGDTFQHTTDDGSTTFTFTISSVSTNAIDMSGFTSTNTSTPIEIPSYVQYGDRLYTVTSVGTYNGSNPKNIKGVVLPETLLAIGQYFLRTSGTEAFESLTIPKNVNSITFNGFRFNQNFPHPWKAWIVDAENTTYIAEEGLLYRANGANRYYQLVSMPRLMDKSSITVNADTKDLNSYAVCNNNYVTQITLPSGLTTINRFNNYIFEGCNKVEKVTIDASGETGSNFATEDGVLYNADKTKLLYYPPAKTDVSFTLPSTVTEVSACAFSNNTYLQTVDLNNVSTLGESSFINCTALSTVTIPSSVSSIDGVFNRCTSLTTYNASGMNSFDGVIYSNDWSTLVSCPAGKTSIVYPTTSDTGGQTITTVGNSAFSGTSIPALTLPSTVTEIGNSAFQGAKSTSITLPEGVITIGDLAFADATSLSTVYLPNTLQIIPTNAFIRTGALKSITLPESLTTIGISAFAYSGLTSVEIPANVTSIGQSAFNSCSSLTSFTFAEGSKLKTIEPSVWNADRSISSLTIPKSVETISNNAFVGCRFAIYVEGGSKLKSIPQISYTGGHSYITAFEFLDIESNPPTQLTSIENGAFLYNENMLTSFTVPASVTSIGTNAFNGCSTLTDLTFEDGRTSDLSFGAGAFADCSGLTSLDLPDGISSIGAEAFRNCDLLTDITIGASLTNIDPTAFKGCTQIANYTVDANNTRYSSFEGFLLNKAGSTLEIFPPAKVRDDFTLLPPSITKIGNYAFYDCDGLHSLVIPKGVTSFGNRAFGLCGGLQSIAFLGDHLLQPGVDFPFTTDNSQTAILNTQTFDNGGVAGVESFFTINSNNPEITLNKTAYTEWLTHEGTGDAYDAFYSQFAKINTTFTNPSVNYEQFGGEDEFYPLTADNVMLVNTTSTANTYVVPATTSVDLGGGVTRTYNINIGDGAFDQAPANMTEVIVKSNPSYIGGHAFNNLKGDGTTQNHIQNIFFTGTAPSENILATKTFNMVSNNTNNEFSQTQNIYVRASQLENYKEQFARYADKVSADIPLKKFAAKDYQLLSREFDVDLSHDTKLKAYFASNLTGLGKNRAGDLTQYVTMTQLPATAGGAAVTGTAIPAGTAVAIYSAEGTGNQVGTYRIYDGTGSVTASASGNKLQPAIWKDQTVTNASDATNGYGYYTLNNSGELVATASGTAAHNTAWLNTGDFTTPCPKAGLLFDYQAQTTTLKMNDTDADATITMTVDYEGPITLGAGLTYTDYNDIPTPGTAMAFTRDHNASVVTLTGNITGLNVSGQKLAGINVLGDRVTDLNVSNCGLYTLDLTGQTALTTINCANNHLGSLDLSNNDALTGGTISPQNVSGHYFLNGGYIYLGGDDEDPAKSSQIAAVSNDFHRTRSEGEARTVSTGASLAALKNMTVNTSAPAVHVQRTTAYKAQTLYLDFDAKVPEGVRAYYCGEADADATLLMFYNIADVIPAHTGVLIKAKADQAAQTYYIYNEGDAGSVSYDGENVLEGTLTRQEKGALGRYLYITSTANNTLMFKYYTGNAMPAYRAYIPEGNISGDTHASKALDMMFVDEDGTEVTSIRGVTDVENSNDAIYDLTGRQVQTPKTRGIYIKNGKKVVIR